MPSHIQVNDMTTPRDAIGLSERLRRQGAGEDGYLTVFNGTLLEAATQLDALQERVKELESNPTPQDYLKMSRMWAEEKDRATRAEQERDEALERLKPFAAYSVGKISKDVDFDYSVHVCCSVEDQPQFKHFDAARDLVRRLAAGTEKEGK